MAAGAFLGAMAGGLCFMLALLSRPERTFVFAIPRFLVSVGTLSLSALISPAGLVACGAVMSAVPPALVITMTARQGRGDPGAY